MQDRQSWGSRRERYTVLPVGTVEADGRWEDWRRLAMSISGSEPLAEPDVPREERKIVSTKKESTKRKTSTAVDDLTAEEREAVTIVFHQFETGLREGTIFTKVQSMVSRFYNPNISIRDLECL